MSSTKDDLPPSDDALIEAAREAPEHSGDDITREADALAVEKKLEIGAVVHEAGHDAESGADGARDGNSDRERETAVPLIENYLLIGDFDAAEAEARRAKITPDYARFATAAEAVSAFEVAAEYYAKVDDRAGIQRSIASMISAEQGNTHHIVYKLFHNVPSHLDRSAVESLTEFALQQGKTSKALNVASALGDDAFHAAVARRVMEADPLAAYWALNRAKSLTGADLQALSVEFIQKGYFDRLWEAYQILGAETPKDILVRGGEGLLAKGRFAQAMQFYDAAGASPPEELVRTAAEQAAKLGEANELRSALFSLGEEVPRDALVLCAQTLQKRKETDAARSVIENVTELGARTAEAPSDVADHARRALVSYITELKRPVPFRTSYTYWYGSDGHDEMPYFRAEIHRIAGHADERPNPPNSKRQLHVSSALYYTDRRETIEKIRAALNQHFLVGYLLSGVAYEIENGSGASRGRKYNHPSYAAWRTFTYMLSDGGERYNSGPPARADSVRSEDDEVLQRVYAIAKQPFKAYGETEHGGDRELSQALPDLEHKLRDEYDRLSAEIDTLASALTTVS